MEFNLRTLCATDLFSMVRIINKIDFKKLKDVINVEDIKSTRAKMTDGDNTEVIANLGVDIVTSLVPVILEHLPSIEKDLYTFLGGVADMTVKDVAKLEIGDFMDLLVAVFKKEEFKDFFNRASKLIK